MTKMYITVVEDANICSYPLDSGAMPLAIFLMIEEFYLTCLQLHKTRNDVHQKKAHNEGHKTSHD